jgi:hypothetical protein
MVRITSRKRKRTRKKRRRKKKKRRKRTRKRANIWPGRERAGGPTWRGN